MTDETLLTAAECAQRLGLTTKALRVYEDRGLIAPRRTEKNWRLYGSGEIARLNEILMLQQLGLTLSRIGQVLSGQPTDLGDFLKVQEETLRARHARIGQSLALVHSLQSKQASGEVLSLDDMIKLAKETVMTPSEDDALAWKRYEQSRPRTAVPIDPHRLVEYPGSYAMEDGSLVAISVKVDALYLQLIGQPEALFQPEAEDAFFTTVVAAQLTFQRDASGTVTTLTLHQNGYEMLAKKVADDAFKAAKQVIEKRIKDKKPAPGSQSVMREIIDQHINGSVDYDRMTPQLADLAKAQAHLIAAEIERLGQLGTVAFKGVDGHGYDVYDVQFANGRTEWGLSLAENGQINGLYTRDAV